MPDVKHWPLHTCTHIHQHWSIHTNTCHMYVHTYTCTLKAHIHTACKHLSPRLELSIAPRVFSLWPTRLHMSWSLPAAILLQLSPPSAQSPCPLRFSLAPSCPEPPAVLSQLLPDSQFIKPGDNVDPLPDSWLLNPVSRLDPSRQTLLPHNTVLSKNPHPALYWQLGLNCLALVFHPRL